MLLFVGRFQNLSKWSKYVKFDKIMLILVEVFFNNIKNNLLILDRAWKEHMRVSSTDIIAPALSNSPQ